MLYEKLLDDAITDLRNQYDVANYYAGKKVLVTGGNGFIGRHVVQMLNGLGARTVTFDSKVWDLRKQFHTNFLFTCYEDVDLVFHLAANVGGIGITSATPGQTFYDNMLMGLNVIEQARLRNLKTVYAGSVCSYPEHTAVPFNEKNLWNGEPELSNRSYGLAKRAVGEMLDAYHRQYNLPSAYVLLGNTYGPCFSGDTSVLTVSGVKCVKDIEVGDLVYTLNPDTHEVEIESVVALQRNSTSEFFNFNAEGVDFRVTPDHQMYYRTTTGYQKRPAEFFRSRLGREFGQIQMAHHHVIRGGDDLDQIFSLENYVDDKHIRVGSLVKDTARSRKVFPLRYSMQDWVEFLGWFISEGSLSTKPNGKQGQVVISQHRGVNPDKWQEIYDLLTRMSIPFCFTDRGFFFTSRLFSNYLSFSVGNGSDNKRLPQFVLDYNFPSYFRERLFYTMCRGDGTVRPNGEYRYTTKSIRLRDDFIHLCFLLGKKTSYHYSTGAWRVTTLQCPERTVKYSGISLERVGNEETFCFTVSRNHLVYAGRGGKLNWVGQCDNFDPDTSHVIPALIRKFVTAKATGAESVTVWGTGKVSRDFMFVTDAARALIVAGVRMEKPTPVNIGSGGEVFIDWLVKQISLYVGYRGEIIYDFSKPDGARRRQLRIDVARKQMGWQPTVSVDVGLQATLEWYEANHE